MTKKSVIAVVVVSLALFAFAAGLSPADAVELERKIKVASAVLGFPVAVIAAIKTSLGVTQQLGVTSAEVVPAGVAAGAGALLVLASAL